MSARRDWRSEGAGVVLLKGDQRAAVGLTQIEMTDKAVICDLFDNGTDLVGPGFRKFEGAWLPRQFDLHRFRPQRNGDRRTDRPRRFHRNRRSPGYGDTHCTIVGPFDPSMEEVRGAEKAGDEA